MKKTNTPILSSEVLQRDLNSLLGISAFEASAVNGGNHHLEYLVKMIRVMVRSLASRPYSVHGQIALVLGTLVDELAQGFDVTGVDGACEMIASALKLHPELSGRLHTAHLPGGLSQLSGPFDGIFSIATLMHLSRPAIDEVFKRAGLLINQYGRFFFSVPCRRFTALSVEDWVLICQNCDK